MVDVAIWQHAFKAPIIDSSVTHDVSRGGYFDCQLISQDLLVTGQKKLKND